MSKFGNNGLQRLKARTKGPAKTPSPGVGATDARIANVKNTAKGVAGVVAQEGFGQALKKFAGNVASKAFGVAGMLLNSQKAYAGPGTNHYIRKQLEEQGYKPLSAEEIKNMDASNFQPTHPPMTDAEFDEYYKDGIPELSLEESNKIMKVANSKGKENNSTAENKL